LLMQANSKRTDLMTELRLDEMDLNAAGVKVGQKFERKPKTAIKVEEDSIKWSQRMRFALQLTSLMNSFLLSFYFMHLHYNLTAGAYHWIWKALLLLPLLTSLFIMLPRVTQQFTVVEAFFSPDGDALEDAMNQLNQLDADFDRIRKMWLVAGEPKFETIGDAGLNEIELAAALKAVGVHIAKARLHRIFVALDEDKSGTVTADELLKRLENKAE